ncbi:MAG: FAD-dependent oxidoreductase [Streptosporangiales bacterium]|nr:FAD-dependent oxidoreductase [Streptosporangiales bacterium]
MATGSGLPARAGVVVAGGGVVGTAVAYHLARRGVRDVLLLERNTLTSGTTWHAAGLVTQARATAAAREILVRSRDVFLGLEAETGSATGYVTTGTLVFATGADRMTELAHQATASRASGFPVDVLGPEQVAEKHPLLDTRGVVGGVFFPQDGRGNATDTTIALARGAARHGATLLERVAVTDVLTADGRVRGVRTEAGDVEADVVVNATGLWARDLGLRHGAEVPLQAMEHFYIVTEKIGGFPPGLPTVKCVDEYAYVKDEAGALLVGFFEPGGRPWDPGRERDGGFVTLPEDWDHIGPFYERMTARFPVLENAGIRLHFCGPEAFTPDGLPHIGPVPGLEGCYVAAGFNSVGFMSGTGVGSVLADWIADGRAPFDMTDFDPARVQPHETNRRYLHARAAETLDLAYEIHWPYEQRTAVRPLRRSPLYHAVAERGAAFGETLGWERANWYAAPGDDPRPAPTWGLPPWHERSGEEHRAVRETAGMFDVSDFGKLLVQGRDALAVLQRMSARELDVEPGRIVYSPWLNEHGGIDADVTVTRLDETRFLVLSGASTVRRDHARLAAALGDRHATVADVGGTMAMLTVMGPRARDVLAPLTEADLSDAAFPFGTSREIDLGHAYVRATRVTYVGELGWELLIPAEYGEHVFGVLWPALAAYGGRMAGHYAMNSLRLEKAYRSWGHDIGPHDTPQEAGLGFALAWDKPGGFTGREALLRQRETGVRRRLVQFLVKDPSRMLVHDEPILRDGRRVGRVCSSAYGHTLGGAVALGWVEVDEVVPRDWFTEGAYEIESALDRVPAVASLRPMYDPRSERPRS